MSDQTAAWDDLQDQRAVVPEHVVHREFASETVLLNVQSGQYHGMDSVGARFFEVIRGAPSLAAAAETLTAEYGQPLEVIQRDLATFCSELQALGLIRLTR
jgi:hypothetical protein